MSFVNPFFLFALAAISIPIAIHLFHFRRFKKVYFSNISFLEFLAQETHKQSRLKHLLVLLSRILAIAFLVIAFARPYIPVADAATVASGNLVSIYIDNSFSMEAPSQHGNLLDHALQSALDIASSFGPGDRFQLLTNDFEGHHQRFVSRDEFISMLDEIQLSPPVRYISEALSRQKLSLTQEMTEDAKFAFVLSDFQQNISDFNQFETDTLIQYFFVPFQTQRSDNLFVDSIWIDNPIRMRGQAINVQARIRNDSDLRLENQPVRLQVNGVQRSVATFDASPFSHAEVSLSYTIGSNPVQTGVVEISDQPVTFDNQMYFNFLTSRNIPILVINHVSENRFLNALFSRDTTFVYRNVLASAVDYSLFGNHNLIILNEIPSLSAGLAMELRRFVDDGGSLLIFPSAQMDIGSYQTFLSSMQISAYSRLDTTSTRVSSFNEMHGIYAGVFERIPENIDLPMVNQYFVIDRLTRSRDEYLMQLQNGNYFLISAPSGQGQVYVSAVPANDAFSNFQRHAMFVPTLYNIALHSHAFHQLYQIIGIDESIVLRESLAGELLRILGPDLEVIPETRVINNITRLFLHDQITRAGNYQLTMGADTLRALSFNYDRRESLLRSYTVREVETLLTQHGLSAHVFDPSRVDFQSQMFMGGHQLWKLFVLLALLCLLGETILLRFWK